MQIYNNVSIISFVQRVERKTLNNYILFIYLKKIIKTFNPTIFVQKIFKECFFFFYKYINLFIDEIILKPNLSPIKLCVLIL